MLALKITGKLEVMMLVYVFIYVQLPLSQACITYIQRPLLDPKFISYSPKFIREKKKEKKINFCLKLMYGKNNYKHIIRNFN